MPDQFSRTRLLLGTAGIKALMRARVAVFGLGGVGGYTVEALARSGVGTLDLIDNDRVSVTNINRQIFATTGTVGRYKVDVAEERAREIHPEILIHKHCTFFLPDNAGDFDFSAYDYVVDAVDTVTAKIELVLRAQAAGTPVISCMGAGNKLDPTAFEVADLYRTSICPLARVLRRGLKKRDRAFEGGVLEGSPPRAGAFGGGASGGTPSGARQRRLCPRRRGIDPRGRGHTGSDRKVTGGCGLPKFFCPPRLTKRMSLCILTVLLKLIHFIQHTAR